jgi:lipid-binding SYLF domain-containing protein
VPRERSTHAGAAGIGHSLSVGLMEVMMQRRDFIFSSASLAAAMAVAGCATTATTTTTTDTKTGADKRHSEIEAGVDATLPRLYSSVQGSRELVAKATGVLVFPRVIAAGLVVGGQYGEGALRVKNKTDGYYSLTSVSIGLQAGAQSKAVIFLFMTQESLNKFRDKEGWAAGVDASVAVLKVGANGVVQAVPAETPVVAFVLTNAGLMANLTLEGTKISRLKS